MPHNHSTRDSPPLIGTKRLLAAQTHLQQDVRRCLRVWHTFHIKIGDDKKEMP